MPNPFLVFFGGRITDMVYTISVHTVYTIAHAAIPSKIYVYVKFTLVSYKLRNII